MALPVRRNRGLTDWDPIADMERQMARMFEPMLRAMPDILESQEGAFAPLADLEETDDAYVIEVELPGVSKDDIDIECRGRRITVSGEREEKKREGVLRKRTRSVGRFFHEVVLPGDIDEENIDASLDDGVLTVRVPKDESEKERTRTIDIR